MQEQIKNLEFRFKSEKWLTRKQKQKKIESDYSKLIDELDGQTLFINENVLKANEENHHEIPLLFDYLTEHHQFQKIKINMKQQNNQEQFTKIIDAITKSLLFIPSTIEVIVMINYSH